MKRAGYIALKILYFISVLGVNLFLFTGFLEKAETPESLELIFDYSTETEDTVQVFWGTTEEFNEENSLTAAVAGSERLTFHIPNHISYLRIDFGTQGGWKEISKITLKAGKWKENFSLFQEENILYSNDLLKMEIILSGVRLETTAPDAYCAFTLEHMDGTIKLNKKFRFEKAAILSICFNAAAILLFLNRRRIRWAAGSLYKNKKTIWKLSVNDFKTKYAGSYFGIFWAFVQPVITIALYWFVFEVGLKNSEVGDIPFAIWLISGLVPWFFHSDVVMNVTNCYIEYSYLVKKILFPIGILPVVKMLSAAFVHLFFAAVLFLVYACFGYEPRISLIWILYFSFCTGIYSLALSQITSILFVFFKDMGQIINIILQIFMWVTPILWNIDALGSKFTWIFKLNPMYYIVSGYRSALFGSSGLVSYEFLLSTFGFWLLTGVFLIVGKKLYGRLRPHFADVL